MHNAGPRNWNAAFINAITYTCLCYCDIPDPPLRKKGLHFSQIPCHWTKMQVNGLLNTGQKSCIACLPASGPVSTYIGNILFVPNERECIHYEEKKHCTQPLFYALWAKNIWTLPKGCVVIIFIFFPGQPGIYCWRHGNQVNGVGAGSGHVFLSRASSDHNRDNNRHRKARLWGTDRLDAECSWCWSACEL